LCTSGGLGFGLEAAATGTVTSRGDLFRRGWGGAALWSLGI